MSETIAGRIVAGDTTSSLATPKLHEVFRQLSNSSEKPALEKVAADKAISSGKSTKPVSADAHYTTQQIAEALYARAPREFITQSEISRLTQIAVQAHQFLGDYLEGNKPFSIQIVPIVDRGPGRNRATAILSAFSDRPFIVDSVSCVLDLLNLRKHLFLHPILRFPNRSPVSLAYIETDNISDPTLLADLERILNSAYHDLLQVTEDFPSMLGEIHALLPQLSTIPDASELPDFLKWLESDCFVFLGAQRTSADSPPPKVLSRWGLLRPETESVAFRDLNRFVDEEIIRLNRLGKPVVVSKLPVKSILHRRLYLDLVHVQNPKTGETLTLVGTFSSRANKLECSGIPMLNRILREILDTEDLIPGSHAYKELVSIVDNLPRAELFAAPQDVLRADIRLISESSGRSSTRVNISDSSFAHFTSALVIFPKQRMGTESQELIVHELESALECEPGSAEVTVGRSELPVAILHLLLPNPKRKIQDVSELEARLSQGTITWEESLRDEILEGNDLSLIPERARLAAFYNRAFPDDYKALVSPQEGCLDIRCIEQLSDSLPLEIDVRQSLNGNIILKIFRIGESHTVSLVFPYLVNTGLNIAREHVAEITGRNGRKIGIYRLELDAVPGLTLEHLQKTFRSGFASILRGEAENDPLCSLLIAPGLGVEEIALLRLYVRYMKQIRTGTSAEVIGQALTTYPTLSKIFFEAFAVKFDPHAFLPSGGPRSLDPKEAHQPNSARQNALATKKEEFLTELKKVSQLTYDRAFRMLWTIFEATVRTSFYRTQDRSRFAIKLKPASIPGLPLPHPFAEIFVSAIDFEGVHLRGGPVARGGIRWSDRTDDYRTEVLGLMKTQMLKNSIIIPTGAKGGFVLKHRPSEQRALMAAVKECYTRYVRSLLEIADNRLAGTVVHPENCIVYDGEDPYFVVAADRGTAMMSDTANGLAVNEFNLWIGDAFASGGSNGYDHKKLAITSRGGWETTLRHFREMGLDAGTTDFTVVGIGDMSGDVFGNGLLRSRRAKLLAAFNHKHIFVDPNPDPESSFIERQRLFDLPGSQWSDYDPAKISKGGGVFERTAKEIPLSEETQKALGITSATLSGQELVRAVLSAPVDLLWNGGIGTYVKSSTEDHQQVGDRVNDDVRIDATELRCRVVSEGGNLGFTQLARIEYAKHGGRINTDAIDNSGGVNMSDLEVNIKILLAAVVADGKLNLEERNALLASLAEDVGDKVTARNYKQSRTISLGVNRSERYLGYYRTLLEDLEREGLLNRRSEFIPTDAELVSRIERKKGLLRPELAIIIGYAKMSLTESVLHSNLPDDPFCERYLLEYFPKPLVDQFKDYVLKHPLKREIIATEIANSVVDRMGPVFVLRTANETGSSQSRVLEAFVTADSIFKGNEMTDALKVLDRAEKSRLYLQLLVRQAAAIDSMTVWLLDQRAAGRSMSETVTRYREPFHSLIHEISGILSPQDMPSYRETWQQYVIQGVHRSLAQELPTLNFAGALMEIAEISLQSSFTVIELGRLYFHLAAKLQVAKLLERAKEIRSGDAWVSSSARILAKEVLRCIGRLTTSFVAAEQTSDVIWIDSFFERRQETLERYQEILAEILRKPPELAGILVLTNQLYALSQKE